MRGRDVSVAMVVREVVVCMFGFLERLGWVGDRTSLDFVDGRGNSVYLSLFVLWFVIVCETCGFI